MGSDELLNPLAPEREQGGQLGIRERGLFAGCLQFDELPSVIHDQIHVHRRVFVFDIVEVQERDAPENSHADRGHRAHDGIVSH